MEDIPEALLRDLDLLDAPSDPLDSIRRLSMARKQSVRLPNWIDNNKRDGLHGSDPSQSTRSPTVGRKAEEGNKAKKSVKFDAAHLQDRGAAADSKGLPMNLQAKHVNRKEVMVMKHAMLELLHKLDDTSSRWAEVEAIQPTYTDVDALFHITNEEQKIYDTVFQEMIRQVSSHMLERGDILTEVRNRYAQLFAKIPKHVKRIYTEAIGHRKIVKRLLVEVDRVREEVMALMKEVEAIRQFDQTMNTHAQELSYKIIHLFAEVDTQEDVLDEYRRLYKLQRERLDSQVRALEKERNMWMEHTSNLMVRIAKDHNIDEVLVLQRKEKERKMAINHIIAYIVSTNEKELAGVHQKVDEWRVSIAKVSKSILERDHIDMDRLANVQRSMKHNYQFTNVNGSTFEPEEAQSPLLGLIHTRDTRRITEDLNDWLTVINDIVDRYVTDQHVQNGEALVRIRQWAEQWMELIRNILYRCEHSVNGSEYHDRLSDLRTLSANVSAWIDNLESRNAGESGLLKGLLHLQSQVEHQHHALVSRTDNRPLNQAELCSLRDDLDRWKKEMTAIITIHMQGSDEELSKVNDHTDQLLDKIVEQMQADLGMRGDENNRLHGDMIRWMVMATEEGEDMQEKCSSLLYSISNDMSLYSLNLIKDGGSLNLIGDDDRNLVDVIKLVSDEWVDAAKQLLQAEKKRRNARTGKGGSGVEPSSRQLYIAAPVLKNESYRTTAEDMRDMDAIEAELSGILF